VNILPAVIGAITTVFAYAILGAGVYKLFAIANDIAEINRTLRNASRDHTEPPLPPTQR
jgi:hypothetical protein